MMRLVKGSKGMANSINPDEHAIQENPGPKVINFLHAQLN